MRKLIIIALILFPLSIFAQDNNISIEGTIEGLGSQQVRLEYLGNSVVQIASTNSDTEGHFKLSSDTESKGLFRLMIGNKGITLFFVIEEKEQIVIKSNIDSFWSSMEFKSVSNSLLDYFAMVKRADSLKDILMDLQTQYQSLTSSSGNDSAISVIVNKIPALDKKRKDIIRDFMYNNPSSLYNLIYTEEIKMAENEQLYTRIDSALLEKYPDNLYTNDLHDRFQVIRTIKVGLIAPEIELASPEGEIVKLSSLSGKVVLIDFWASWCGPCRRENPNVVKMYNKFNAKGFEIYSVSVDKKRDDWLKAIKDDKLTWTHVLDKSSAASKIYGAYTIPHTILIDGDGKILAVGLRGPTLKNKLNEIFKD